MQDEICWPCLYYETYLPTPKMPLLRYPKPTHYHVKKFKCIPGVARFLSSIMATVTELYVVIEGLSVPLDMDVYKDRKIPVSMSA